MERSPRSAFNASDYEALFARYREWLVPKVGEFPFRLAETPLFFDKALLDHLAEASLGITAQLSTKAKLAELMKAIPPQYDVPGMTDLPDCVQVDFALCRNESGALEGKVVELQAFPSLYALETLEGDAWNDVLQSVPDLRGAWSCFFDPDRKKNIETMRRCILGGLDPEEVVLVDFDPPNQKTAPDFAATKLLFDVDSVCVTDLKIEGRKVFRDKNGKRVPVKRIYNRMVFDELEVKKVAVPFRWNDELDVTWCSHPNWYWVWSKFCLPHVDHPAVPKATFLSELLEIPSDLESYVLKPLFSFAGSGVIIDVTRAAIDAIPEHRRAGYVLQRKIEYAWTIELPPSLRSAEAPGVKAEVRVMLMREGPGKPLAPLIPLVRLSRGKMLGVDQNKSADTAWTGGAVGIWRK
ncbi:hypothetical protein BH09MYX1_BH09MYX1_25210 [soil metagenome]